jgi:hypothetical protein
MEKQTQYILRQWLLLQLHPVYLLSLEVMVVVYSIFLLVAVEEGKSSVCLLSFYGVLGEGSRGLKEEKGGCGKVGMFMRK